MNIDIYIREKNETSSTSGTREIRVPILPDEFFFPGGDAMFISCDIIGRGEVAVPSGTELGRYYWKSELPGALRKSDAMIRGSWKEPSAYVSILDDWKKNGTLLNLLVTGYPVNVDVYLEEFLPKGNGAFGDISYEIIFKEARTIKVQTIESKPTYTPSRWPWFIPFWFNKYQIKSGDTLWSIAQHYYGDGKKYPSIYEANRETIESVARSRGYSSSERGHWIFPGVNIYLP